MVIATISQGEQTMAEATNAVNDQQRIHQLWQERLGDDLWYGWRALLAGRKIEGVAVPVDANTPFTGYYRTKRKDKTFAPVAYWYDKEGNLLCTIDGKS